MNRIYSEPDRKRQGRNIALATPFFHCSYIPHLFQSVRFECGIPHEQSQRKTWFGYWKEDGFVKTKHKGRIDQNDRWSAIRDHWVEAYRNRDDIPGECVKQYVTHADEWCAEAYMSTDYASISKQVFEVTVKNYMLFKLNNGMV